VRIGGLRKGGLIGCHAVKARMRTLALAPVKVAADRSPASIHAWKFSNATASRSTADGPVPGQRRKRWVKWRHRQPFDCSLRNRRNNPAADIAGSGVARPAWTIDSVRFRRSTGQFFRPTNDRVCDPQPNKTQSELASSKCVCLSLDGMWYCCPNTSGLTRNLVSPAVH
jgi:hypothetical protein